MTLLLSTVVSFLVHHVFLKNPNESDFLLIRGPHAFLGHGWLGCSREYQVPEQLDWDYGEPTGLCTETAANSGVFTREWTKSTVTVDCKRYRATIQMK